MIKKNFLKILILLLFVTSCGYAPVFTNKKTNFSIYELNLSGNSKLNKIINSRLNNYKGSDGSKKFSLNIETSLNKEISSKDIKGNPKTFRIVIKTDILIKDSNNKTKNKLFSKSIDYNNQSNKSELKKYEKETSNNLVDKIADEVIIYLQSL